MLEAGINKFSNILRQMKILETKRKVVTRTCQILQSSGQNISFIYGRFQIQNSAYRCVTMKEVLVFRISPYSQIPGECLKFPHVWQLQFWEDGQWAQSRMKLGTSQCPSTSSFITGLCTQITGQWSNEANSKSWNECPLLLFVPFKKKLTISIIWRQQIFLLSKASRSIMGPTQPPRCKALGAWSKPHTSWLCQD